MEFIAKLDLDDTSATSNVPYPDTADGEVEYTAGTYSQGTQRVQNGNIYEVVATSTSDTIDAGLIASPATWIYIEPANFFKPLRNDNETALTYAEFIQYQLSSSANISGVALFGVGGQSVTVRQINSTINPVSPHYIYNITENAADNSEVYDWLSYWTLPSNTKETFYFNDLNPYSNTTTQVAINATGGTAQLENLIIGELVDAGETLSNMEPVLRSTSRFIDTEFGRTYISKGSVRELNAEVKYDTAKHDYLYRRLEKLIDVQTAWAGTSKFSTSVVLGSGEVSFSVTNTLKSDATYQIKRYTSDGN